MKKGALIVMDGGDGAGKQTQTELLLQHLRADGRDVETLDFPQYTNNTFGALIRECLDGKRGDFLQVDARIASTLYAADRFESKDKLETWLAQGKIVVLDRYVSANMMHQGAKIQDPQALEEFLSWLDHIEHTVFGVPRPDAIFYFDIPHTLRRSLKQAAVVAGKHTGTEDVHERDQEFQRHTEERARQLVAQYNNWHRIDCCTTGTALRTREDIHAEVYALVETYI